MTDGTAAKTPSSTHNLPQPSPLNLSALRSTSPAPPFVPTFDANSGARRAFVEIEQVYEPFRKQQNEAADFVFSEEKSARLEPAEPLPTSPPPPPYHDAERKAESSGTPGTMKNDIFASAFREGSIFHGLLSPQVDTPKQRQRDAPTPQSNRPNSASTPADTPRSKNSIFEMSHTISKPAVNMDANELSALRQGRLINSDELTYAGTSPRSPHQYYPPPHAQPPSTGKTYYGQGSPYSSSMTVPLSLPTPPAVTPSIASPPAIDNEAVFLTDANTSGRRGFVDLDESQFKVTPIVTVRKRPVDPDTEALTSPALLSPSSEATPAPSAKLRAAAEEARRRKARDRPQVIVSPAKWDNINLTFLPTRRNFLGEGRYAQVYLGYYTVTDSSPEKTPFPASSPRPPQSGLPDLESSDPLVPSSGNFHPCAVKRLHNTLESQSVGLSEVCILRKLSPLHPNIVKLIGVKDEADVDNPNVKAQLASSAENPTLESRPQTKKRTLSDSKTIDPSPRLLILLEYLPKGDMWEWVQRNKQSVGKRLWVKWARQLASAIACMHAEGIVHHDIKPHNVLLTDFLDVRLADFGNACFVPEQQATMGMFGDGPPPYTSMSDTEALPREAPPTSSESNPATSNKQTTAPAQLSTPPALPTLSITTTPAASNTNPPQPRPTLKLLIPTSTDPKDPHLHGPITPGSPTFPDSQTLHSGLGRGTTAYTAPELFGRSSGSSMKSADVTSEADPDDAAYSFPVDVYSLGVTLYTLLTGIEPFPLARTATQLFMGARKGFFESGLQRGVGVEGLRAAFTVARAQSHHKNEGGPPVKFLAGDAYVEERIVGILEGCLAVDPGGRWTARRVLEELEGVGVESGG